MYLKQWSCDKLLSFIQAISRAIYYYNSNLIQSAGSRQVDRHGSPDQTRRRASSLIYSDPRRSTRRDPALRIKLLL